MASLSHFANRMHSVIFRLSRFKKFWHLSSLYHTLNLSILLCTILELRLIHSFLQVSMGEYFCFFWWQKCQDIQTKPNTLGFEYLFFLQLYQLVQWRTNFTSLRGTYICRPLEPQQHYSSLINSITQCFNLGARLLK